MLDLLTNLLDKIVFALRRSRRPQDQERGKSVRRGGRGKWVNCIDSSSWPPDFLTDKKLLPVTTVKKTLFKNFQAKNDHRFKHLIFLSRESGYYV